MTSYLLLEKSNDSVIINLLETDGYKVHSISQEQANILADEYVMWGFSIPLREKLKKRNNPDSIGLVIISSLSILNGVIKQVKQILVVDMKDSYPQTQLKKEKKSNFFTSYNHSSLILDEIRNPFDMISESDSNYTTDETTQKMLLNHLNIQCEIVNLYSFRAYECHIYHVEETIGGQLILYK